jgi:histidinol dehydrogenase
MCNSYSSLGLADFTRRFTVQELTFDGLNSLAKSICPIAIAEGLDAHARAVTIRLEQGVS